MFEKYKERKEKQSHLGMSKREYYKVIIMALVAVICLVVILLHWGSIAGTTGTEVTLPKPTQTIEMPGERPRKAGEKGAREEFKKVLDKLRKQQESARGEPEKVEPPPLPKPPAPWESDPDIWNQVDDLAVDQFEEQMVYYVLHQLNSMTQEKIDEQVARDGWIPSSDYASCPGDYRGKFVSITGTLMIIDNLFLPENRSGLQQVWYGIIYSQRQKPYRKFYFYIFDKDREWLTQQESNMRRLNRNGDLVTLNGVFVKLYRNRVEGGTIMTYPFIVARKLKAARGPTMAGQYPWAWLVPVCVGLAAVFIVLFLAMHRDRKADEAFLQSRKQKRGAKVSNELARRLTGKSKGDAGPLLPAEDTEKNQNMGKDFKMKPKE